MSEDLRISLGFEDRPVVDGLTRLRKEFGELGKTIDATGKVYGPGPGRGMPTPEFMTKLEQGYARQKAAIEAMGRAYQASQERIGAAQAKLASSGAGDAQRAAREELDREVIAREKVAKRIESQIKAVNRLAEDTAKANRLAAQAGGLGINVPKMAAGLQGGGDVGSLNRALAAEIKAINDVNKSIDAKLKKMDEAVAAEQREVAAINVSIDSQLRKMDALDAGRVKLFQSQQNIDAAAAAARARITAQMKADEDKRAADAAAAQLLRLKSLGATAITEQAIADQHSALRRAMLEDSKRYDSAMQRADEIALRSIAKRSTEDQDFALHRKAILDTMIADQSRYDSAIEAANERARRAIAKRSTTEQDFALQHKAILDTMRADQEKYDTAIEAANERARRAIAKRSTSEQDFAIQHKAILDAMRSDQEKHESAMEALRSRGLKEINGRAKVEQKVAGDLAKIRAALLADEVKFDASQAAAEAARVAKHKQAREMELQIDQSFVSAERRLADEMKAIQAAMNADQDAARKRVMDRDARMAQRESQRVAEGSAKHYADGGQQQPAQREGPSQYSYGRRMDQGFQATRAVSGSQATQTLTSEAQFLREHNARIQKLAADHATLMEQVNARTNRTRAQATKETISQNRAELAAIEDYNRRRRVLVSQAADMMAPAGSSVAARRAAATQVSALSPAQITAPKIGPLDAMRGKFDVLMPQIKGMGEVVGKYAGYMGKAVSISTKFVGLPFRALGAASGAMNALSFSAWKLTSGLNTAKMAWTGFMNVVKRGEEMERTRYAFETMTKGIGVSIEGLRKSSGNMIDDRQLMKLSTFGAQAKMDAKSLEMMMKRSQGAALVTGRDPEEILKRMVMGVGKREREIMDELTVMMPNATKIWQEAAKKAGKGTDRLTEDEKQVAYLEAFEKASRHLDKAASNLPTSLTKVAQYQAKVNNLMDDFTSRITRMATETSIFDDVASMVSSALDGISNFINESGISGLLSDWMPKIGDILGHLGSAVGQLGPLLDLVGPTLAYVSDLTAALLPALGLLAEMVAKVARVLLLGFAGALVVVAETLDVLVGWIPELHSSLNGISVASKKAMDTLWNLDEATKANSKSIADLANKSMAVVPAFQAQIASLGQLNNAMTEYGKSSETAADNVIRAAGRMESALKILKSGPGALGDIGGTGTVLEGVKEGRELVRHQQQQLELRLMAGEGSDPNKNEVLRSMLDPRGKLSAGATLDDQLRNASQAKGNENAPESYWNNDILYGKDVNMDDVALKGFEDENGKKIDLTYRQVQIRLLELKKAQENLDKMYDAVGNQSDTAKITDMSANTEKYYEDLKISIPTIKSERNKPKSLEGAQGIDDRLSPGKTLNYSAEMTREETARYLDALSMDLDADTDEWKYDESAVRANINAFQSLANIMADDIFAAEQAADRIKGMSDEAIQSMAAATLSESQLAIEKARLAGAAQANIDKLYAEKAQAELMVMELRDRLPPKKGSGGGRSKQESIKYIMPELIEIADQNLDRINQVLSTRLGHAAEGKFLWEAGEKYSSNMAYMISGAVERNIQDDIENHRDAIHDAAIKGMETVNATVANAAAATSPEQFADYMALHGQAQMAVQKSGFLEGTEEDAKRINAALAATSEWFSEQETLWGHFKDYTDQVKVAQDAALQSQFDLQTARYEAEIKLKEHMDATTVGFGNNSDTPFANGMRYTKEDMPEWRRAKMKDPREAIRAAIREREEARIIAEADLKKEEMRASWRASGSLQDTELETNLGKVDRDAKSKIGGLRLADSEQTMAFERAQIEEHAQGMQEAFDGLGNYVAGTAGNALTYSMVDAFSVWQNATLTMTEDWTENMMAMIESAVSDMGTALDAFTSKTVELYTGSGILGTGAGALVGGVFKGLMSLFKQKSDSDKQEKRAAEREMRRKETKKTTEFSVTVINQSIPVTHVVQNQLAKNMKSFLRSGGKLQGAL